MAYQQPNFAPECCRAGPCIHLERRTVQGQQHDRCLASHPMHDGCPWCVTAAQEAERAARMQDLEIQASRK